jgi:hypothetical protein
MTLSGVVVFKKPPTRSVVVYLQICNIDEVFDEVISLMVAIYIQSLLHLARFP